MLQLQRATPFIASLVWAVFLRSRISTHTNLSNAFLYLSIVLVFHEPLLVVKEVSWDSKTLYSHFTVHIKQLHRQK